MGSRVVACGTDVWGFFGLMQVTTIYTTPDNASVALENFSGREIVG